MKKALITGITGQDGSYLAELLLGKGYEVTASSAGRARSTPSAWTPSTRIPHVASYRLRLVYGDLDDASSLGRILARGAARRDLQPGRAEPRARQLRRARVHRVDGGHGHAAAAGGDARAGRQGAVLPGVVERDVRRGAAAPEREHAVPAAQPLRLRQGVRPPAVPELPRGLRHVHLLRHPVQPRIAAARASRSSPARSPAPRRASSTAWTRSCTWATWTPSATGDSPATTSRRCG